MKNILYKWSAPKQKIIVWRIMPIGEDSYQTETGELHGKLFTTPPTKCEPKNIGKSNETTATEQRDLEINYAIEKKLKEGYVENIEDAKITTAAIFEPMLAFPHTKVKDINYKGAYASPKLDGIRMTMRCSIGPMSRNWREIPAANFIYETNEDFFLKFPNLTLDGEFYSDDLSSDFDKLISLARKSKITSSQLDEIMSVLRYHVYDLYEHNQPDLLFSDRLKLIEEYAVTGLNEYIKIVPHVLITSEEHLNQLEEMFLEKGYEGLILRQNTPYEQKRSKGLIKFKRFIDEEFEIVDIEEGNGTNAGMAGALIVRLEDGQLCKTGLKLSHTDRKEMLRLKNNFIGGKATITYFRRTKDNMLLLPVFKGVRDYE